MGNGQGSEFALLQAQSKVSAVEEGGQTTEDRLSSLGTDDCVRSWGGVGVTRNLGSTGYPLNAMPTLIQGRDPGYLSLTLMFVELEDVLQRWSAKG